MDPRPADERGQHAGQPPVASDPPAPPDPPPPPPSPTPPTPPSWYPAAFDRLTDVVIVIGPDGTVRYNNPFADEIAGYPRGSRIGSNMADHLAPADLERALEVIALVVSDTMDVPITPAVYDVRCADGSFLPIEFNSTDLIGIDEGSILLFGRYSGDRDLQDQLLRVLTAGEPVSAAIEMIPQYGHWRHPHDHYAVHYRDTDGQPTVKGDPLSVEMGQDIGPGMPWRIAAERGEPTLFDLGEIEATSPELAQRMLERALTNCWVFPVDDPLGGSACALVWGRDGEVPIYHRYALELMQRSLALALRWRQQVMTLTDAAHRDSLTGLSNRTGFFAAIENLRASGDRREVALLYIDLDGFKSVNDQHGHLLGDDVLAEAGRRIADVVRPVDTVARLGGDEFAVLCTTLRTIDDAIAVAERILVAVAEPFTVKGVTTRVGASIGIATTGTTEVDVDRVIHAADLALYKAKRNGRNRWELSTGPA